MCIVLAGCSSLVEINSRFWDEQKRKESISGTFLMKDFMKYFWGLKCPFKSANCCMHLKINFVYGDLKGVYAVHVSATCTFEESHICGYTQDTSDNFNWDRGSGATITPNTGPAADHTLGSGSGACVTSFDAYFCFIVVKYDACSFSSLWCRVSLSV